MSPQGEQVSVPGWYGALDNMQGLPRMIWASASPWVYSRSCKSHFRRLCEVAQPLLPLSFWKELTLDRQLEFFPGFAACSRTFAPSTWSIPVTGRGKPQGSLGTPRIC